MTLFDVDHVKPVLSIPPSLTGFHSLGMVLIPTSVLAGTHVLQVRETQTGPFQSKRGFI